MKQRLLFYLLVMFSLSSYAQVMIGSGTTQTGYSPVDNFYGYNYTQQIFSQSEIGTSTAGSITGLSFFLPATASLAGADVWTVYIGHTTSTAFTSTTDWQSTANHSLVYQGNITNQNGVVTINFTEPFFYNATDNLILTVVEVVAAYPGSANRYYNFAGVTNSTLSFRSDSVNPLSSSALPAGVLVNTKSVVKILGLNYDEAPICPTISAPAANATNVAAKPTINWNSVPRATHYTLSIGTTSGGNDILDEIVVNTNTYTLLAALPLNTSVYARVTAHNSVGSSGICTERMFTTTSTLACPSLTAPANASTGASIRPTFTFSASASAASYSLSIGTTSGGTDILNNFNIGSSLSYTLTQDQTLQPSTTYYYTVNAVNGSTVSSSCTIRNFTTTAAEIPENDDCINAIELMVNPDLSWSQLTNGTTLGATGSSLVNSCNGNADDDVWYSFTATHSHHIVRFSNHVSQGTTNSTDIYVQLLSGTCGNLTSLVCSDTDTSTNLYNLIPGQTYYLKVYSYYGIGYNIGFNIGIGTVAEAPENDLCSDAIEVPVNPDLEYYQFVSGTTLGASNSNVAISPCTGTADDDVWFSFTAETISHSISLRNVVSVGSSSSTSLYAQVFSGTCGNLVSKYCFTGASNTSGIIGNLVPNQVYYVRVYNSNSNSNTAYYANTFDIAIGTPPSPPENDNCSEAIELTVNEDLNCGVVTSGTTNYATESPQSTTCGGTKDDDVWYSFVATSANHQIKFSNLVSVGSTNSTDIYVQIAQGSCSNLQNFACSDNDGITNLNGLVPGETYYLRVYSYGAAGRNIDFDICIGTLVFEGYNDECDQAEELPINYDLTSEMYLAGTTFAATNSGVAITPCTGTPDDDVWYTFTAIEASHSIVLTNIVSVGSSSSTSLYAQVFSGQCGQFTSIACHTTTTTPTIMGNLTPGETYYVRVFNSNANGASTSYWNSFRIAIGTPPSPPENDECIQAIALETHEDIATTGTTQGTTYYATASLPAPVCTTGVADDDVWYSFVATSTAHRVQLSNLVSVGSITSTDIYLQVLSGTCGNLNSLLCTDENTGGVVSNLTIGETYYARVYSTAASGRYIQFDIRIGTPPPPPANDDCANAVLLVVNDDLSNTNTVSATTLNATQSNVPKCTSGNPDDDVWHKFVATNTSHYVQYYNIASVGTSTTTDLYYEVLTGDNCTGLTSVKCSDTNAGDLITGLIPGNTYYVRTYTYYLGLGYAISFDVRIGTLPPPPVNDNCSGAIALEVQPNMLNLNAVSATTLGATPSLTTPLCTSGNADDDVWFSFVATATTHSVDFTNLTYAGLSTTTDLYFQVLQGNCSSFESKLCSDSDTGAILNDLTIGSTYYVRVYTYSSGSFFNFKIGIGSIPQTPVNDNCINAITLTPSPLAVCSNSYTASTAAATQSVGTTPTCSATGINDDIWFAFEATNDSHFVYVNYFNNATAVQAYSGSCDEFVAIGCVTGSSNYSNLMLNNLNIGETYYLRIYSSTSTAATFSNFNICILTPDIPQNNDCYDAIDIACGETLYANTIFASDVTLPSTTCGSTGNGGYKSVWYTTTAVTSGPMTVSTCGSSYDTYLRAFSGQCGDYTCISTTSGVGYSDDNCSTDPTPGHNNASKLTFNAEEGITYYFLVGAYSATTVAGNMQIKVTSDCNDVGIENPEDLKKNITIYPNPFNDTLNISDITDVNSITVVDMLGRVSKSITKVAATINLSDLTSGMYLVTLHKKDGSKQTFKTIKN